ncbi:MAG: TIGR02186 family protein [Gemmobacter sp.]
MIRAALVWLLLAVPAMAEGIVAGLSQNRVAITANFDGSEIIVYGAVRREAPPPAGALDVIVTIEGPSGPVTVRRKERRWGIWVNAQAVRIAAAPSFYAIATTAPLPDILSETENLRHKISIPRAIRAIGSAADAEDSPAFTEALIRLRRADGAYLVQDGAVDFAEATLLRADVRLPANLTEGRFRVRVFLVRGGDVVDHLETAIDVEKQGLERWLHRLAFDRPFAYGILSLVIAVGAGWAASAAFRAFRR